MLGLDLGFVLYVMLIVFNSQRRVDRRTMLVGRIALLDARTMLLGTSIGLAISSFALATTAALGTALAILIFVISSVELAHDGPVHDPHRIDAR